MQQKYLVCNDLVWQKVKAILAAYKIRKRARSEEINFLRQSQPNNEEERRRRREGEAELEHIPAKAVSNDVTFRKKGKTKKK